MHCAPNLLIGGTGPPALQPVDSMNSQLWFDGNILCSMAAKKALLLHITCKSSDPMQAVDDSSLSQ